MSLLSRLSQTPQCISCLRRTLNPDPFDLISSFRIQLRGKKKGRKEPATVKARLLKDIRGWGRQGAIVPVPPGRMRNIWYPKGHAEYMTSAKLKEIQDLVIERDPLFGMDTTDKEAEKEEEPVIQMELLSPHRSTHLIQTLTPPILLFYRPVITTPSTITTNPPQTPTPKKRIIPIFGSVSTADIASYLQQILKTKASISSSTSTTDSEESNKLLEPNANDDNNNNNKDASRVVLGPEDVSILPEDDESVEGDRIKALGDFRVDVLVKGGEERVRKVVRVAKEEEGVVDGI